MSYEITLEHFEKKKYHSLGDDFSGMNPEGEKISFTNYYMEKNEKPFLAVSGEFHYSRCEDCRWEDEILKMKMCGISVISSYVFWIHHEEEEGVFDFTGRRDLRKFVELCKKHGMYVILRIGPFAHGEVRNGGLPDWLYGKPFEVRKLSEGFLSYTRRFYEQISQQIGGLLYKDGGPVIAVQIDNEYMHSSAPWEIMTGLTNEWVFGGDEGEDYMLTLQEEAKKCGIRTPFYTCTGWGGAITPKEMMPLWGGYAYRPWLFYAKKGDHPVTEEYVYQDYHNNKAVVTSDFKPAYQPEDRPYACCEMGGGMMCTYNYRFTLPFKSVDAMANIKLASGCNFLGYYVFQGGTNPKGKHGAFLNEGQVTRLSYDYQAALGEFGQIRPSYRRLKTIHQFCNAFGETFCEMQTVLPDGASEIAPVDLETLRFAVRTDGKSGFLFLNNFQDHIVNQPKQGERVDILLPGERISFDRLDLAAEENCILPFHMDLEGIDLVKATAQPITRVVYQKNVYYVFMCPDGMTPAFTFEEDAGVLERNMDHVWSSSQAAEADCFHVKKDRKEISILLLSRKMAEKMYLLKDGTLLFTEAAVMEEEQGIRLESMSAEQEVLTWPKGKFMPGKAVERQEEDSLFDVWKISVPEKEISVKVKQTAASKYTITFPQDFMSGIKDAILRIRYQGDIACAFIDGDMVHDNFCNGDYWEIGLRTFADRLYEKPLTISVTPLKEGASVNVESAMAARKEEVESCVAKLEEVSVCPVYEWKL